MRKNGNHHPGRAFSDRRWLLPFFASVLVSVTLLLAMVFGLFSPQYAADSLSFDIVSFMDDSDGYTVQQDNKKSSNDSPLVAEPEAPRIAYLITGTKGDSHRMRRTLQAIYHPRNQYILHLDLEAPPRERIELAIYVKTDPVFSEVENVRVIAKANLVTYKGPTMIACTLHAIAILLKESLKWDWFINSSASDYPLMTQDDLLHVFSSLPRDLNFIEHMQSTGWKTQQRAKPIIIDPGLYLSKKFDIVMTTTHRGLPASFKLFTGVTNVAKLLGCKVPDLMLALSTRESQTDNGSIVEKLTLSQAIDNRDALAKSIYASLFDWLVERINKSLEVGKSHTVKSISILDIYGFESFQKNGFQQLCINYANERLQQHINHHLFKLEQEEYTQDGIDWAYVDFVDNIERLNLFEKKPLGIFSLLDEESTLPKATDLTLANKLKQQLNGNPCFKGERGGAFKVHHYAGEVLYHTNGFLEKNRDPLHSDSIQLLLSSACQLPQLFASHEFNPTQTPDSYFQHLSCVDSQKRSIGTMFKGQLFNLMQQLENTTPHFIQCIKPNSKQLPGIYENEIVLQQLRCCGVLEVVKISRLGYQTRMTHQQFAERYGFLLFENVESQDPLDVSVAILQHFNIQPEMYQVGYKKLFFRTGQIAALEVVRNRRIKGILCVQKFVRGHQARHNYRQLKKGATTLQSFIRGEGVRYQFQKHVKQPVVRKTFDGHQKDIVILQSEMSNLNHEKANRKPEKKFQQKKDPAKEHEFQRRVLKAEAVLRQKEEENVKLQQQLQQYDTRWSEYEAKIKSKEEMWQKQVTSLQMSLASANKNLADASPVRHDYDSESAISTASRTPQTTPPRPHSSDAGLAKYSGGTHNAVGHLVKEFEQHTQVFEDDARFLVEVKPGQLGSNVNPVEELQKLKFRFAAWKKDYRGRLREAKAALYKLGFSGGEKTRRKWWGKKGSKT